MKKFKLPFSDYRKVLTVSKILLFMVLSSNQAGPLSLLPLNHMPKLLLGQLSVGHTRDTVHGDTASLS